jgi:SAM-dependent methyltransferase
MTRAKKRGLRESLALLRVFLFSRRQRGVSSTEQLYALLGDENSLAERSRFVNLGLWRDAETYDDACTALARHLFERAGLAGGARVLDVGCGFGDAARLLCAERRPAHVIAINLSRTQLEVAARVTCEEAPGAPIAFLRSNATALPFADASFDLALALESAFHFRPRHAFLREAARVLTRDGRIALADIVLADAKPSFLTRALVVIGSRLWPTPIENRVALDVYLRELAEAGFRDIAVEDVSDDVFVPFKRFARRRVQDPDVKKRLNPLLAFLWGMPHQGLRPLRYIIVSATRASPPALLNARSPST